MSAPIERLFGTDGIRGEAGLAPLDALHLRALGSAIAATLATRLGHAPRLVLGRDTRESGPDLLRDVASGLAGTGASVRSAGVLPTPGISLLARSSEFDAGIMISASHNPWQDNGLKIFSKAGSKLDDALEAEIESRTRELLARGGSFELVPTPPDESALALRYEDWLVERGQAMGARGEGLRIAIDCANGAASQFGPAVLRRLGAEVFATCTAPDGRNINLACGSMHLESVAELVRRTGAGLGVALDGDADRALCVDARGEAVDGDQILCILAAHLKAAGRLRGGAVVGTVMSNLGLERSLADMGLLLVRERVGDRFVLERMMASGCNLGGEPSGHVIFLDEAPTGDGLLTTLHLLAALAASTAPLQELAARMQRCPQVLLSIRVRERVPLSELPGHSALAESWARRLGDAGRILVRYSGTEKLVRVMVEGADEAEVRSCADALAANLDVEIGAR